MNNINSIYGMVSNSPVLVNYFVPIVLFISVWSLFWKGLALWHAGRRGQSKWFIIILIVNTVGALEIIYLFAILKLKIKELFSKKD